MKKRVNTVLKYPLAKNVSDVEKRISEQLIAPMERADIWREQRREEFNNTKCTGAKATTYRFSYWFYLRRCYSCKIIYFATFNFWGNNIL